MTFTKAVSCVYLVICLVSEMFSALRSSSSLLFLLSDKNSTTFTWFTTFLLFYLLVSLLLPNGFPQPCLNHQRVREGREAKKKKKWGGTGFSKEGVENEKEKKKQSEVRDKERMRKKNFMLVSSWKKWVPLY